MPLYLTQVSHNICSNFVFPNYTVRNTQIPVVKQILLAYLNKKSFILEAPTGVGKTIISVLTINAISEYHKKSGGIGYVLTSSKALQDQ